MQSAEQNISVGAMQSATRRMPDTEYECGTTRKMAFEKRNVDEKWTNSAIVTWPYSHVLDMSHRYIVSALLTYVVAAKVIHPVRTALGNKSACLSARAHRNGDAPPHRIVAPVGSISLRSQSAEQRKPHITKAAPRPLPAVHDTSKRHTAFSPSSPSPLHLFNIRPQLLTFRASYSTSRRKISTVSTVLPQPTGWFRRHRVQLLRLLLPLPPPHRPQSPTPFRSRHRSSPQVRVLSQPSLPAVWE